NLSEAKVFFCRPRSPSPTQPCICTPFSKLPSQPGAAALSPQPFRAPFAFISVRSLMASSSPAASALEKLTCSLNSVHLSQGQRDEMYSNRILSISGKDSRCLQQLFDVCVSGSGDASSLLVVCLLRSLHWP